MTIRQGSFAETKGHPLLCDLVFLVCAALFAWLAMRGILEISADGAALDSDLQTYAQGMTAERYPELFAADPALNARTEANSIPNLERYLADKLAPDDNFAAGLLRAGAFAIFFFYAGWYAFGRRLLKYPSLAAALALCCGVTFWVGWGTFWGVLHSDPVPRTFFAAIFPFLLVFLLAALRVAWLRPLCMLATGLCMWVHGVSALNCGAMFFAAFLFIKPPNQTLPNHINNCALALIAFAAP
ncbi:MAG: translation initiation factor 2, partial [Desulfovibrio sp.]|nr:translation initiation factor 2 [Desulfovibrio sp.]